MLFRSIRANIRDDKIHQIYSAIQTGGKEGMMTMNMSLYNLYAQGKVNRDTVFQRSMKPDELEDMFQQAAREAGSR